jgi:peptide/nickel transport system permease protein
VHPDHAEGQDGHLVSFAGTADDVALAPIEAVHARRQWLETLRSAARLRRTRLGLLMVGGLVVLAVVGPLLAPHSPSAFVGPGLTSPSKMALLGTDSLGRDVLSRFLHGGRTVISLALLATILGVGVGAAVGMFAAYARGLVDGILMRTSDVLLAFPQIVLVLLLVTGAGTHLWLIVVTVALGHAPRTARVIRAAAMEIVERDFIKAAEVMGESRWRIVFGGIMPMVTSPLLVEFGLRMVYSIALVTAVSFLGFGLQPPTADWGLMINENRLGIIQQPWSVVMPVLAIGLLTVGTNLITDGVARAAIGLDRRRSA